MKSRAECLTEYGSDYMIQQKVNAGELFKVGKAVYSEEKDVPELAVLAFQYPNAVVTMNSAFYMHGLTFSPSGFFEQGVETTDYRGFPIRVYGKERMLIELLRYKSKLPFDYYKEILLNYRKILPHLDMQAIQDYAYEAPKSGKVMETLQMEVL